MLNAHSDDKSILNNLTVWICVEKESCVIKPHLRSFYRSALLFFQPGLGPGFLLALGSSVLTSLLFEELRHLKECEIFLINLPSLFRNSYGRECIRPIRVNSAICFVCLPLVGIQIWAVLRWAALPPVLTLFITQQVPEHIDSECLLLLHQQILWGFCVVHGV